ncbi:Uncharacterised protein [uncultured archaeon]|nr:Uncharacterised protein [uncultured archaeon]
MNEKKNKKKICCVLLVVSLVGTVTMVPSVNSLNYDLDKNKSITNNPFFLKNQRNNYIFSQLLKYRLRSVIQESLLSSGLLSSTIYTNCNGVEKYTEVFFGVQNDIDVDNNLNTGINGADIRVQYLLLPWIEFDPVLAIGGFFTLSVERLSEEIKDADFHIALEVKSDTNMVRIGYHSLKEIGNEIPNTAQISFILLFTLTERTKGFGIYFEPTYNSGNQGKKIELFAESDNVTKQQSFSMKFDPAIETQFKIISTKIEGQWQYYITRTSSLNSEVTIQSVTKENGQEKNVTLIVDKLPQILSFTLALTPFGPQGGSFLYESSEMYDIELTATSNQLGTCRYVTIKNTPTRVFAEWTPTLLKGFYSLDIESNGTDIIVQNSLTDPSIILKVNNLGNFNFNAYWNLSNPGDFTVYKERDLSIDLDFKIGEWVAKLNTRPTADYIATKWLIDVTGYLTFDTNLQSLGTMDILIKSEDLGLQTVGETFKADDWRIDWTIWPPAEWNLVRTGTLTSDSISIDLFLKNFGWLHLWPWPV